MAADIAGQPPAPNPEACEYCTHKGRPPQALNDVTVSLALGAVRSDPQRTKSLLAQYGHLLRGSRVQDGSSRLDRVRNGVGPGSQLWRLLESLGVQHSADCQCLTRAEQMNAWGPAGCRERRVEITDWMRQGQDRFGWRDKLTAATRAVTTVLAFRLSPLDPFPGIIDEAIRRAETAERIAGDVRKAAEFGALVGPVAQVRPQKLILKTGLCPGDILTLTAAVESLHRTYPEQYVTDVRTPHPGIWTANPHVTPIRDDEPGVRVIDMHYPSINRCNQESIPFLAGYTEYLGEQLQRPLRLRVNRPYLYLTPEEAARPLSQLWPGAPDLEALARGRPIWLVNAGVKSDYTIKGWPWEYFQTVVNQTSYLICWVQIGLREHLHRDLHGVVNLMDGERPGPPMRETILLASRAAGGLGPVTFLQHLMAAWQRPYICLVGGREPATWVQYPHQHTMHQVGRYDCCREKSCWRARVVPLGDHDAKDKSLCEYPIQENLGLERPAAKCMADILPSEVILALERLCP